MKNYEKVLAVAMVLGLEYINVNVDPDYVPFGEIK